MTKQREPGLSKYENMFHKLKLSSDLQANVPIRKQTVRTACMERDMINKNINRKFVTKPHNVATTDCSKLIPRTPTNHSILYQTSFVQLLSVARSVNISGIFR
jgi:hypothetical protein